MNTWVKLNRDIFDLDIFKLEPFSTGAAYVYLIANASFTKRVVHSNGIIVEIDSGEICTTLESLSEQLCWKVDKTAGFLIYLFSEYLIDIELLNESSFIIKINDSEYYEKLIKNEISDFNLLKNNVENSTPQSTPQDTPQDTPQSTPQSTYKQECIRMLKNVIPGQERVVLFSNLKRSFNKEVKGFKLYSKKEFFECLKTLTN